MKFEELSVYLNDLEKTPSRLEITRILAELFSKSEVDEIDKIVYLILGSLAPSYKNIVFNLAERMMVEVLAKAYNEKKAKISAMYLEEGDLGSLASRLTLNSKNKTPTVQAGKDAKLSVTDVYNKLLELAEDGGEKSVERKIESMASLLSELDPQSARFVTRIPIGRLRLGFSDKTILDALSWMEVGGKEKKAKLETAYNILPDVGLLAKEVKKYGIDKAVKRISPKIGIPTLPMLAQRLKSPKEMIKKMGTVSVEPKFDGLRIQIHFKRDGFEDGTFVKAFTRNLNETSWMFPELSALKEFCNAKELILDSEAVGIDEGRRKMANFQTTMTRRRKYDIENIASKVSIKFYVFDIIFKDGESYMDRTYEQRRGELAKAVKSGKLLQIVDYEITTKPERIIELMKKNLKEGLEGVLVKKKDSKYVAGRTGWRWVKMKEDESAKAKLADTVDCVVMGYSAGRGKRVSFGIGQFLVGVRDGDEIKTVTKVGTGLTDDQFRELNKRLADIKTKEKPKNYVVNKLLEPDFWVIPEVVVEIAADEITKSPNHTSGLALRFPRLVKFRDDRSAEDATNITELTSIFGLQKA